MMSVSAGSYPDHALRTSSNDLFDAQITSALMKVSAGVVPSEVCKPIYDLVVQSLVRLTPGDYDF